MAQVDALLREIGTYTRNRQNSDPQDTTREGQTSIPGNQISTAHYTHLPTHTQPPAESQPIEFEPQASRWVEEQSYGWTDPLLGAYDEALLAEPYGDRQRLAVNGLNRRALPASSSARTHPSVGPRLGSDDHQVGLPLRAGHYNRSTSHSQPSHVALSQYAHVPSHSFDASSPPLARVPSSPSFEVSQRRTIQDSRRSGAGPGQGRFVRHPPSFDLQHASARSDAIGLGHKPPMVQGIQLFSLDELPDRFRSVFPFSLFNAIQSKCYEAIYKTNDNLILSAPTGSGKTAVLEMAICRLVAGFKTDQYKIVYMAPTKSLCSERHRDWQARFASLDLQCAELTGDTDQAQLRNVQNANIIITTPEKWDSMTRKWKDHSKLIQLVKLFLIDEVHILKDRRGATLEAVVSRMKSVGSNVRFIALSAAVPNSEDIATWLGKNPTNQHLPAVREKFGEEFRPVKLQKVVYGFVCNGNDFVFEKVLDSKLPDIIAKHSCKKPMMIFCFTRNSTVSTAKALGNLWATKSPRDRHWPAPTQRIVVQDAELKNALTSGVAFHHAGLDGQDRHAVEKGFLDGQISVICCTSTLAVGVNLPCHLIIIKNTVSWQDEGIKEYADLEMMQMLGRAGRPQFDNSAVAVIITRSENVKKYEKMVSGEELLESCLHLNLVDHLNAEIGLGTINDVHTAKRWLAGTFLYVRLAQNPNHYKLDGDTVGRNLDDRIEQICRRDIGLLQEINLITSGGKLKSTEFGEAMARYYVKFETMKVLLSLEPRAKISEILSALVQADEFHEVRLRGGEKNLYKEFNIAPGIKFPIKVNIALSEHKRSLIVQAELGAIEFPAGEQFTKHKRQYQQDKAILFSHVHRLIRCIIDCQLYLQDSVATRHALELARSFGARVWDNSPLQMKQISQIGAVAVRKLAVAGINSIEALEATETHRMELLLNKQIPFGMRILAGLKDFPKLRVSVKMMGKDCKPGQSVRINVKAEIGFINDKAPIFFHRKPIFVCFLAERSDGHLVDFRRVSAKRLGNGQDVLTSADLLNGTQYITCYVMCDEIAGTMRYAELKPGLPASMFPRRLVPQVGEQSASNESGDARPSMNIARRRSHIDFQTATKLLDRDDEFRDDDFDDNDFMEAADKAEFNDIDTYDVSSQFRSEVQNSNRRRPKHGLAGQKTTVSDNGGVDWKPEQLRNGKWACNHKCRDKKACKHLCCHEGLDKAPKPPKNFAGPTATLEADHGKSKNDVSTSGRKGQPKLFMNRKVNSEQPLKVATVDLAHQKDRGDYAENLPQDYRKLHRLHESATKTSPAWVLTQKKPTSYTKGDQPRIDFLSKAAEAHETPENLLSDYEITRMDDFPSPSALIAPESRIESPGRSSKESMDTSKYDDDDSSELEAAMVGIDESLALSGRARSNATDTTPSSHEKAYGMGILEDGAGKNSLASSMARSHESRRSSILKEDSEIFSAGHMEDTVFLSTNSSTKGTFRETYNDDMKRKVTDVQQPGEGPLLVPIAKKQKTTTDPNNQPLQPSTRPGTQATAAASSNADEIPRGFEGIDLDILAMFRDIVDFV